jgi:folate-binding protein YgfZ
LTIPEQIEVVRRGAGLFALADRGLIEVTGGDRVRWLNGMLSNDVSSLEAGPTRSGCYALLLTVKGAITADLHVLLRPEAFWLETSLEAVPGVIERLERYIVADDVTLADRSDAFDRIGVEGPSASELVGAAGGEALELAPESCAELSIGGQPVVAAAFGWTGESAVQLFVERGQASAVRSALESAVGAIERSEVGSEALEVLRIEAGTPQLGAELDEEVLPDEAGLDRAISMTKGCYTGQEIVARVRSRGQVNHLLVGLEFEGDLPEPGAELHNDTRRTGEVTSCCASPSAGNIGLGFVRRADAEPGTTLRVADQTARVASLPFVAPSASGK